MVEIGYRPIFVVARQGHHIQRGAVAFGVPAGTAMGWEAQYHMATATLSNKVANELARLQAETKAADVMADARRLHMGFLTPEALAIIAADGATRLTPVVVRCSGGRFTAPAQDAQHFIDIIGREGSDWVRDVSLVAR